MALAAAFKPIEAAAQAARAALFLRQPVDDLVQVLAFVGVVPRANRLALVPRRKLALGDVQQGQRLKDEYHHHRENHEVNLQQNWTHGMARNESENSLKYR